MSSPFENVMQGACRQSLYNEFKACSQDIENDDPSQSVEDNEITTLARKIGVLPTEYKNILFFRYCFGFSAIDTEKMLQIENAAGKWRYILKMLSVFMGVKDDVIDESSMKKAAQLALLQYTAYDDYEEQRNPRYSRAFRRKLKEIGSAQKSSNIIMLIANRVAIFVLVCAVSFCTVLAANAQVREKFFHWIVETFPQFSSFIPQSDDENAGPGDWSSVQIGYVPEGFALVNRLEGKAMVVYEYSSGDGRTISVLLKTTVSPIQLDTENADIREIPMENQTAYTWEADGFAYLVWQWNGMQGSIVAETSSEEVLKIAENIKK